jgi:hypothetical protein
VRIPQERFDNPDIATGTLAVTSADLSRVNVSKQSGSTYPLRYPSNQGSGHMSNDGLGNLSWAIPPSVGIKAYMNVKNFNVRIFTSTPQTLGGWELEQRSSILFSPVFATIIDPGDYVAIFNTIHSHSSGANIKFRILNNGIEKAFSLDRVGGSLFRTTSVVASFSAVFADNISVSAEFFSGTLQLAGSYMTIFKVN